MSKNQIKVLVVVVLVVIGLGFWVNKINSEKGYSIVYFSTGEVYIGKLTTFPGLRLKDSYILQITKDTTDPNKNNFQLNPIKDALWAPEVLHLNKKNIIFYGPIMFDSQIAKTLASQKK